MRSLFRTESAAKEGRPTTSRCRCSDAYPEKAIVSVKGGEHVGVDMI
jgi:hypothetical protein